MGTRRLLLKTDNSRLWVEATEFVEEYAAFTPEAAEWLVAAGLGLVGTDYLSVQRYDDPHPGVHTTLLGAGVIIVEGLNLLDVSPGLYQFICLPLKVEDGDGAPARAVLLR
jgi:arylformamidase